MIIGGTLGSVMGTLFAGLISVLALVVIFVVVSVITVLGIYLDRIAPVLARKIEPGSWCEYSETYACSLVCLQNWLEAADAC